MKKELKSKLLLPFNVLSRVAPEMNTKLLFRMKCGYKLDLKHPTTYNEKLNWLKLYYRNDLMPRCADKYAARGYIEEAGFGQYLPKLFWHGTDVDKIPFEELPDRFVIKSTSGSGNNIIVKNKRLLDIVAIKKEISGWLKEKYLPAYGEWHYEHIKASIIVEEFLGDDANDVPADYKYFYLNGGGVFCIAVDIDRFKGHKRLIYDREWNYLKDVDFGFDNGGKDIITKPAAHEQMCKIAELLSQPFPHCRVDFFVIKDRFYIGELTFFNGAGFDLISPMEYNKKMGNLLILPDKT